MALTPLDFPASPTVGQLYPDPPVTGQPTYRWDGAQWLSYAAASLPTPTKPANYGKKNYIINGAMMISQENGTTSGTVSGYYPVDQFRLLSSTTGYFIYQNATVTPSGSPYRFAVGITTPDAAVAAGDYATIVQAIEGQRVADLQWGTAAGKTVTLQFGVRGPAGTYCVSFQNALGNANYVAEYTIAVGEANTDVVKSVTIPPPPVSTWNKDNTTGISINWTLMVGNTYQQAAGAWNGAVSYAMGSPSQFNFMGVAAGNQFHLFDVSLTEGSVAPPFQVPDYVDELVACRRYYKKNPSMMGHWGETSSTEAYFFAPHTPPMRAGPTVATLLTASRISRQVLVSYNVGPCTLIDNVPSGTSFSINTATAAANVPASLVGDTVSFNARL